MQPLSLLWIVVGAVLMWAAKSAWTAWGTFQDLQRKARAAIQSAQEPRPLVMADLVERIERLEKKVTGIDLTVLDAAEKVANRLADRERKRAARSSSAAAEDVDLDDEAEWWARARAAHPLPGMPIQDPAQLALISDDEVS